MRRWITTALGLVAAMLAATSPAHATKFISPTGSGTACTSGAPCKSWQNGYAAAAGGEIVQIAAGSYTGTDATINNAGTKSPAVTLQVVAGATATIAGEADFGGFNGLVLDGTLGAGARGLNFQSTNPGGSFIAIGWGGSTDTTNFTLKGAQLHGNTADGSGQALFVSNCSATLVQDVDIYNIWRADGIQGSTYPAATQSAGGRICNGITFDRVTIHDMTGVDPSLPGGDHQDGIQIRAGANMTFRNMRIYNLNNPGSQGYFPNPLGDIGSSAGGFLFENNVLYAINGNAMNYGDVGTGTIRNNTFDGGVNTCSGGQIAECNANSTTFTNNLYNSSSCVKYTGLHTYATTWAGNVLAADCGFGDAVFSTWSTMFVSQAGADYHLSSGSFAINKGSTLSFSATDVDGTARGSNPDAGAYEATAGGGAIGGNDSTGLLEAAAIAIAAVALGGTVVSIRRVGGN